MGPPFQGLKVIELAEDPAGELVGRLLAEMGAEVIKVEPPEGSPTRRIGPFARDRKGPDTSLNFWWYNSNKKGVTLDVASPHGAGALRALLAGADVFICTLQPKALAAAGLDLDHLSADMFKLIVVSVTPFGLTGPWADYRSSDLVALALGGPLNSCGYDDHSIPPIRPGGNQGYHSAASFAHMGVLLALLERQKTGLGQIVDVSMHEACALNVELANAYWFYPKAHVRRQTCRHAQPAPTQPALFRCDDGRYVFFLLVLAETKPWRQLVHWLDAKGMAAQLTDPAFLELPYRQAHFDEIQAVLECFFLVHDAEQIYLEGQAHELPIGLMNAPEDLFEDAQLMAREFFVQVQHEGVGAVPYPGPPYRFSSFGAADRRHAPDLAQDNESVLTAIKSRGAPPFEGAR